MTNEYVSANIDATAILMELISGKNVSDVSYLGKVCILYLFVNCVSLLLVVLCSCNFLCFVCRAPASMQIFKGSCTMHL